MTDGHRDLAPERQRRVLAAMGHDGAVRVDALSDLLAVSPATVRRDLEELERQGLVQRVHGGAILPRTRLDEPWFEEKTAIAGSEKLAIARAAAALIEDGETIYLDGGSTLLELARLLVARDSVTVVTNSLRAAHELSHGGPRLILIGGELRRRSQTLVGALTRVVLDTIHLDKAFMGTMGISVEAGMTTTDPNEAFTKELVMTRARQVILLAHSDKIGNVAFAHAGGIRDLTMLITDAGAPPAFLKQVRKCGCRVIEAGRDGV